MSHYKRKKSKRHIRCSLCTKYRFGNSLSPASKRTKMIKDQVKEQINEID